MLVYVNRSDLINSPVPVVGYYEEALGLAIDFQGSACTMLFLPQEAIDKTTLPPTLTTDFRANWMVRMVDNEAQRRIALAFPDYMQRNTNADINTSSLKYGIDSSTWPADAQARKAENDRGWAFVSAIRTTSDALGAQTATTDPTDDNHWPTQITPVYIPPT